jgi:hypothetical protein
MILALFVLIAVTLQAATGELQAISSMRPPHILGGRLGSDSERLAVRISFTLYPATRLI